MMAGDVSPLGRRHSLSCSFSRSKWSCCSDTSSPIRQFPLKNETIQSKELCPCLRRKLGWSRDWLSGCPPGHKRIWHKNSLSRDSLKSSWHQSALSSGLRASSKNMLLRKSPVCVMYICICKDTAMTISICSRKKPQIETNKRFPRPSVPQRNLL